MNRTLTVAICGLMLVGCSDGLLPAPVEHDWQTELVGAEGWEHLSGDAAAAWQEGTLVFAAGAAIEGDEVGAIRPWHVHFNTCAESGDIVGLDADYPRLQVGADGTASTSTLVPLPLDPGSNYHVNVHLSDTEMETIIACGDLTLID